MNERAAWLLAVLVLAPWHGGEPPAEHLAHMRERLGEVATRLLGEFGVDDHMRNIPDHYHARPRSGRRRRDR